MKRSPWMIAATSIQPLPQSICPLAAMNGSGRSRSRLQIEPHAHASGAMIRQTSPSVDPDKALPAFNHTTPAKPTIRPSHSIRDGWRPRNIANTPANSGIDATAIAARPELTWVSARFTKPFDNSTMKIDSTASVRHCFAVGARAPRPRSTTYISAPARNMRHAPSRNGG